MFKLLLMIVLTFFFGNWKVHYGYMVTIQLGYNGDSEDTVGYREDRVGYSENTVSIQWGYSEEFYPLRHFSVS